MNRFCGHVAARNVLLSDIVSASGQLAANLSVVCVQPFHIDLLIQIIDYSCFNEAILIFYI